ncbi:unnamed protein product [Bursaphelenchus xylophilus]|uniref:(pine wood nematode) hypothetical protein n=1 Tax=Bursaphelenchus xylophilus TaxID=6326 RepID=A0A1I7S6A3_BURXY|nr:unnamed protein product [Bursaphelenchus xylophilus]CAG9128204.1 unnamed protein product [Bursaphelenchus xylophilus]
MSKVWFILLLQVSLVVAKQIVVDLEETAAPSDPMVQHDAYGQGLTNNQNVAFTGTISIGTPRQNFRVRFDTGAVYTWVPVRGCKEGNRKCAGNQYSPTRSSTSRNVSATFQVKIQNGTARGSFFEDVVELGPADGKNNFRFPTPVPFGGADQLTNGVEAVVGLPSFSTFDRKSNHETSLLFNALKVFEKPIFTFYMGSCQDDKCKKNGKITFGGYDEENCGPEDQILWLPLSDNSLQWTVKFASINVGPRSIGQNIPVVSDTGSPTLSFPPTLYNQLIRWLKVKPQKDGKIVVPCGTYLNISFADSAEYPPIPLPSANLMKKTGNGNDCEVLINQKPGKVIFGAPFIRSYCQVYDMKDRRLGIIPPAERFDDQGQDNRGQDGHDHGNGGNDGHNHGGNGGHGQHDHGNGGYDNGNGGHNHGQEGHNHGNGGHNQDNGGYDNGNGGHNHGQGGHNHENGGHDHGNGGYPPYSNPSDPYGQNPYSNPSDPYGQQHQHGGPSYNYRGYINYF